MSPHRTARRRPSYHSGSKEITGSDQISRPDAIIIGGGIGGLACAVGLTRKGVRVRLYEKSGAFGKVGAGLQLAPNCTRILDNYGLLEEAIELGVVPEHMRMLDALEGDELTHLDLADVEKRYGFSYMVMHRSDLYGLLLREARRLGVEMITSADCVDYESVPGGARVSFTDGRTDEAEVVIAADGLHSVARRLLVNDEPVNSAYVAYRGAVPFEAVVENEIFEKDVSLADQRRMRGPLRDHPSLRQVPPLHLLMSQPGVGRVDQVKVGALPVPHLPARVPRVAQDRRHRAQRPPRTRPVRVPRRVRGGRARDPGVVQRPGDPRRAVPGQPLREHPPDHRRRDRVRFQPVRPTAPGRVRLVRMRSRVAQPVPVRRAAAQVPALLPGLRGHRGGRTGRASPAWRRPRWPRR